MANTIDIVDLIEKNPIIKLPNECQNKFIVKIKQKFTESQQNLFIASFYCYLNYDPLSDFVIDLRNVWNWLGFSRIEHCKVVLLKHFVENIDYTIGNYDKNGVIFAPATSGAKTRDENKAPSIDGALNDEVKPAPATSGAGIREVKRNLGGAGQNKEKILMNIHTFKKLCLKSNTKKADEVHEYFVILEDIIFETLNEETNELRMKLIQNNEQTFKKIRSKEEKIIDQFPENEMCIYIADIGTIDDEHLVKFGETNNLKQRVTAHRKTFKNFELITAYKVVNSRKFENLLKEVPEVSYRKRNKEISGKNKEELMMVDSVFNIEDLNKIIKNLIEKHCTLESYLADIDLRKAEIELEKEQEQTKQIEVQEKTKQLQLELEILKIKNKEKPIIQNTPIVQENVVVVPRVTRVDTGDKTSIVKKYIETCTEFSPNRVDSIFVEDMYSNFESWFQERNPCIPTPLGQSGFSRVLANLPEYSVVRVPVGQRVNNATPRKTALIHRKFTLI